jgi:hypothetical protein
MTFFELTNFVLKKFSTTTFFYSHPLFFIVLYSELIVFTRKSGQNQANEYIKSRDYDGSKQAGRNHHPAKMFATRQKSGTNL